MSPQTSADRAGRYGDRARARSDPRRSPCNGIRALLLNPFYAKDPRASFGKHVLTPTLALTSIAGATPPHWDVRYWDENLLQGPPPARSVAARRRHHGASHVRAARVRAGVVVSRARFDRRPRRPARAVVSGGGAASTPMRLRSATACSCGRRFSADIEQRHAAAALRSGLLAALSLDPPARRAILPRESFLTTTSVIATRGCHNRCGFCYLSTDGLHMPYRMREVQQVVDEIAADGQPYAVFVDNNLGSRPEYLRKLCEALRPLGIIWSAAVTIDVTDDPTLVREMALAGCTGVFVGFESLNEGNLTDARKRTPAPEDYARRVALLHRYGIQVNGSFVLGFDHDGPDVFERTVQWIEENRLECATFHILTPYPGTPLFRQIEAQGRILHRDWDKYDTAHVVFQPKHMSCEELDRGYAWCYDELFSHASIWRRRPSDSRAVLAYLAMSYLYKRSNRFWHLLIRHRLTRRCGGR